MWGRKKTPTPMVGRSRLSLSFYYVTRSPLDEDLFPKKERECDRSRVRRVLSQGELGEEVLESNGCLESYRREYQDIYLMRVIVGSGAVEEPEAKGTMHGTVDAEGTLGG